VAGSPEEFNSKVSLIKREKNIFYAENFLYLYID
jgi:hypothetical protein